MKSPSKRGFIADTQGVFGLTSVQQFFAIILALAILGYVIVVTMAALNSSTILQGTSSTVLNESGFLNATGYTLTGSTQVGFRSVAITSITNATSGVTILAPNYTVTAAGVLRNATTEGGRFNTVNISYTFVIDSISERRADDILGNTSAGVSGFFGNVTPVFGILAILVIILVLVVLVRVVTGSRSPSTQL